MKKIKSTKLAQKKKKKKSEHSQIDEALVNFRIDNITSTIRKKKWKISKKVCTLMKKNKSNCSNKINKMR